MGLETQTSGGSDERKRRNMEVASYK